MTTLSYTYFVQQINDDVEHLVLLDGVERSLDVHLHEVQSWASHSQRRQNLFHSHLAMKAGHFLLELLQRGEDLIRAEEG